MEAWGKKKPEQPNSRLIHVLPTTMASGFLDCHIEFIVQTIIWTTTSPLGRGEGDIALINIIGYPLTEK